MFCAESYYLIPRSDRKLISTAIAYELLVARSGSATDEAYCSSVAGATLKGVRLCNL